ncbi:glucose-6-phosphate dehydrogenase [Candidatus Uhrbacteria bacterium]|nr:glucose-6-phosphate dehydrogenase [Candidatus Uhrbacteria bacterium]
MTFSDERGAAPTILIILGVTGDLVSLKITPALFHLFQKKKMPDRFRVVGFARRAWTKDFFYAHLTESIRSHFSRKPKSADLRPFLKLFSYHQGDFSESRDFYNLADELKKIDDAWGMCSNKLFYLSASPFNYEIILRHLAKSGLSKSCANEGGRAQPQSTGAGWTRIIVEKPFGTNLKTAQNLDRLLGALFAETQIYRIDHYLGKEMLQNILTFRFSNNLFEENWTARSIEKINVRALEKIGVQERAGFYDTIGALKDYGQNHLLQMLALVTMDHPRTYDARSIREARARLLSSLHRPTKKDILRYSFRGQYDGYRDIPGVARNSVTETYFKVRALLDAPRWRGMPIYLESGKVMHEVRKEIEITFRHPFPCLCPSNVLEHYKNRVIFRLEPKDEILIYFWAKKPGFEYAMEEQVLRFSFPDGPKNTCSLEAHERLLLDCITGDQTLFVRTDEIVSMWKFIDPIIRAWQKNRVPLKSYTPHSDTIRIESEHIEEI